MQAPKPAHLAALLRVASVLIESRQPQAKALFSYALTQSYTPTRYLVRFDFPGVVSVHENDTGALVVRSLAGRPTEPDTTCGLYCARQLVGPALGEPA